jgi:organic radical activating enzyme
MVWWTGGEPTDHDLGPLLKGFAEEGLSVALATSGVRPVRHPVDWLSVSPHVELAQTFGNEIKIVPGLHGLDPWEWLKEWDGRLNFWLRFFQPLDGDPDSLDVCKELWHSYPHWGISLQTHKLMGLP